MMIVVIWHVSNRIMRTGFSEFLRNLEWIQSDSLEFQKINLTRVTWACRREAGKETVMQYVSDRRSREIIFLKNLCHTTSSLPAPHGLIIRTIWIFQQESVSEKIRQNILLLAWGDVISNQ